MILGVGLDLLNLNRVKSLYSKYKDKFINRILSTEEKQILLLKNWTEEKKINYIAKRFCGKEAFAKAIGDGIGRGLNFNDISILNNLKGKPEIIINEKIIECVKLNFNLQSDNLQVNISFSDDCGFVNSVVIISN